MRGEDVVVINPQNFEIPEAFGEAILQSCRARGVDFIGQYGWAVQTPPNVIEVYRNKMVNQHNGPLDPGRPDFGGKGMRGLATHTAVLYFARHIKRPFWTEATAQRVDVEYDKGAVLASAALAIRPSHNPISLGNELLLLEHSLQIQILQAFADGRVQEIVRDQPLILPGEEEILIEAKRVGRLLFPRG